MKIGDVVTVVLIGVIGFVGYQLLKSKFGQNSAYQDYLSKTGLFDPSNFADGAVSDPYADFTSKTGLFDPANFAQGETYHKVNVPGFGTVVIGEG